MLHLISLLPIEIVTIIARETEDLAENYNHIKSVLIKRYKLNADGLSRAEILEENE